MSRFFQSWVEDTKKMDLAKVRDGYPGDTCLLLNQQVKRSRNCTMIVGSRILTLPEKVYLCWPDNKGYDQLVTGFACGRCDFETPH